jgi:hypothetical protein
VHSGDLFGDLGQGWIARPGILEPIFRYSDGVRAATPFPNQTRAGLQAEARCGTNPARCPQGLCHRLQLAPGRLAEPAMRDFLKSVTEARTSRSRLIRGGSPWLSRRHSRRKDLLFLMIDLFYLFIYHTIHIEFAENLEPDQNSRISKHRRMSTARAILFLNRFPGSGVWRRQNHDPNRGRVNNDPHICLPYRRT